MDHGAEGGFFTSSVDDAGINLRGNPLSEECYREAILAVYITTEVYKIATEKYFIVHLKLSLCGIISVPLIL